MPLDVDVVLDRRRLKRQLVAWRILAVLAIVGAALALLAQYGAADLSFAERAHVARIEISGLITDDDDMVDAIKTVEDDDAAKALIVHVDSPGGTVVGSERLYEALREVAKKKPVAATMGTVAASGGYMVSLAAERVFAQAGTITGSIGVIMQAPSVVDLLGKLGVKVEEVKSAPLKAVPSPFEKLTPEGRAATQSLVNDMYKLFVGMVQERRGLEGARLDSVSDGRVFTGRQAVELGLVDALGGDKEARAWLASAHDVSDDLPLVEVKPEKALGWPVPGARALAAWLFGKTLFNERVILDGLLALWQPQL